MVRTAKELAEACIIVAENYKTLYVRGCFGAPMTNKNKERYTKNHAYNRGSSRTKKILAASSDTFGFDCVCLIKGLLWGWNGDVNKTYGGAVYKSNNVPDKNANGMISICKNVSKDFSNIQVGEAVWMDGHIGVYIGNGLAVESTPSGTDGVQITAVTNIGKKAGYKCTRWTSHGKFPFIDYPDDKKEDVKPSKPNKAMFSVRDWQTAATQDGFKFPKYGIDGKWGPECESVASKAICKKRTVHKYKTLTKLVQKSLKITADGKFGPKTHDAVVAYQNANGLEPDGHVGPLTWKKMLGID